MEKTESKPMRAFRFALDPTPAQATAFAQHAGAQRWAYNYALALKVAAHEQWRTEVEQLVAQGTDEATARKTIRMALPNAAVAGSRWRSERGDARDNVDGVSPWWREVSSFAFSSGFRNADAAWKNWLDSRSGRRAGRAVGYPRFKKKGRARDSFSLYHDVKAPTIRPDGYRRLLIPRCGSVRLHESAKPLCRLLERGQARIKSVTVARGGKRWYASVLCELVEQPSATPSRRQTRAGVVGIDMGVKDLAILSTGEHVPNPRHLDADTKRLAKAQRKLSRTEKGSNRRRKAATKVGQIHHRIAERRASTLHQLSKRLTSGWAVVAVEDLNVAGMTRTAKGTLDTQGRNVRAKAGLNRSILDASFAELRRQIDYKAKWYGAQVAVCDRFAPTSKTCSSCGAVKAKLRLDERTFTCDGCGLVLDRDENAALNIARMAVARDRQETKNARGGDVRPRTLRSPGRPPTKREDPVTAGPPEGSNPLASQSLVSSG